MVEATRLASLAPGEWRLWIDRSAERLRIPRAILQDLIVAIIKDSEKKAREAETAARRQELAVRREQERKQREQKREQERIDKRAEHKREEKEKAFESLISLPNEQQETRLGELAKQLDEDVAVIRDDFAAFVGMQSWAASTNSWNVELWPDPVETQKLLQKISAKIRKYIVLRPEALIATALYDDGMGTRGRDALPYSSLLTRLAAAHAAGRLQFFGDHAWLADRSTFAEFLAPLHKAEWVVYAKQPFAGPEQVLRYLSRYTRRVAISNRRLICCDQTAVTFKWKDYRIEGPGRYKTMTLDTHEFIRRFLIHVLPKGFHRIRHYGLLAGNRAANIARARQLLAMPSRPKEPETPEATLNGPRVLPRPCPCCGGRMIIIETFARGCEPSPTPVPAAIRIDTS